MPLMVLAYLWKHYRDIRQELLENNSHGKTIWSGKNITIESKRDYNEQEGGWWNTLEFLTTSENQSISIILRTFRKMLMKMIGDYFSEEASLDEPE